MTLSKSLNVSEASNSSYVEYETTKSISQGVTRTSHTLQIQKGRRVGESLPVEISTPSCLQAGGQEASGRMEKGVSFLPSLGLSWGCWEEARGNHLLSKRHH